jgi:hypothetical protein
VAGGVLVGVQLILVGECVVSCMWPRPGPPGHACMDADEAELAHHPQLVLGFMWCLELNWRRLLQLGW